MVLAFDISEFKKWVCGFVSGNLGIYTVTMRPHRLTIKDMQATAKERGGQCLSRKYEGSFSKLLWKCSKGHIWLADPNNVRYGSWCPICGGTNKLTIEEMRELAEMRGGYCLSTTYKNTYSKLRWQCESGHIWEAAPKNVKRGTWCPFCAQRR